MRRVVGGTCTVAVIVVIGLCGLWTGCFAPKPSLLRGQLLRGPATPCQAKTPRFAELHIHPFERFFQRREAKGRFVLFVDRAPLRRLQHSGMSLVVASLVMPQNTSLSVSYAQAIQPGKRRAALRAKVRRTITHELVLAKALLGLENLLLSCCAQEKAPLRHRAIDRFRESAMLRAWRKALAHLPGKLKRHVDAHIVWRLRQQKRAFLCQVRGGKGTNTCGKPFQVVKTAAAARRAIASGKIAVVLALEQLGYIATPADVDYFYEQGVRLSTLVHLSDNCLTGSADIPWAHGGITMMQKGLSGLRAHLPKRRCGRPLPQTFTKAQPAILAQKKCPARDVGQTDMLQFNSNQGLTKRGMWVLGQMIKRGMLVDLAHSTETTMRQLLWCQAHQAAKKAPALPPFLHSHTNFRLGTHKRLPEYPISAAHLRAIYKGGGMVGMGFHREAIDHMYPRPNHPAYKKLKLPSLLTPPQGPLSKAQANELWVLRAILHNMNALIMQAGGPRPIAFGTDYNGRIAPPALFPFADKVPQLLALLQRHQCKLYQQMAKSADAFLTLWAQAERIAAQWQRNPPVIGDICKPMQAQLHKRCPWQ